MLLSCECVFAQGYCSYTTLNSIASPLSLTMEQPKVPFVFPLRETQGCFPRLGHGPRLQSYTVILTEVC